MKNTVQKRGEGYIDVCIAVLVFVMLTVITVNLFGFVNLKIQMDQIADELIETATYFGGFEDEFNTEKEEMKSRYFNFETECSADEYYNSSGKVQLGNKMWVTVSVNTDIKGLGVFKIPVTLKVRKSGISEKYWK